MAGTIAGDGDVGMPSSAVQLLKIAEFLQTINAMLLYEIVDVFDLDCLDDHHFFAHVVEQLLVTMPVMSVTKHGITAMVNMHEFVVKGIPLETCYFLTSLSMFRMLMEKLGTKNLLGMQRQQQQQQNQSVKLCIMCP